MWICLSPPRPRRPPLPPTFTKMALVSGVPHGPEKQREITVLFLKSLLEDLQVEMTLGAQERGSGARGRVPRDPQLCFQPKHSCHFPVNFILFFPRFPLTLHHSCRICFLNVLCVFN